MNNIKDMKQKVNSKYGIHGHHNTIETRGALATAYIKLYLLKIVFNNVYCDTDGIYLINNDSEGKNE